MTDLYGLARYCNFGALKEELIRDRIVVGLQNRELSEKRQLDPNLTLEKATNLARQRETVNNNKTVLTADSSLLQRTLMASEKQNKTSKRSRKASLKRNLPIAPTRKILIKSAKGALENCTRRKRVLHASPSVTSVQKSVIGRILVKVQNQEKYLKLLKRKNRSF